MLKVIVIEVQKIYHDRKLINNTLIKWSATNNILIDIDFMKVNNLSFNFAMMYGGEDRELFLRVWKKGGKMVWCQFALVSEYIAINHISVPWAVRRAFRLGATVFIIESAIKAPFQNYMNCISKGVIYLTKGFLFTPYHFISSLSSALNSLCDISHGFGFLYGLFSKGKISEYI